MTISNKIILGSSAITLIAVMGMALITDTFPGNGFFVMLGLIAMAAGAGCLGLSALSLIRKDKSFSKGYFISSVLLLALGFISFYLLKAY